MIRDNVAASMESLRQRFVEAAKFEDPPWSLAYLLCSSLEFGYLKLESEMFLKSRNTVGDDVVGDFSGVSFVDVKNRIMSMLDLGYWKICSVPVADRIPRFLAALSMFIPVVGAGIHIEGLHARLSTTVKHELAELLRQIEGKGWGVDLNQVGD